MRGGWRGTSGSEEGGKTGGYDSVKLLFFFIQVMTLSLKREDYIYIRIRIGCIKSLPYLPMFPSSLTCHTLEKNIVTILKNRR